ncbi:MAG TPA: hypothetical protein VGJ82_16185 [Thermoanaerobaculia bacterium]
MIRHIIAAAALTIAPAVFAQTYIVPQGDCGEVTLHVTGAGPSDSTVAHAYVHQPKDRIAVKPVSGYHSLDFKASVAAGDVVMAAVEFKPVVAGNETRTEHAKALLFCGPQAPVADWQGSTRLGLELYPQSWNPLRAHMKAGDTLRFIAVEDQHGHSNFLGDLPMELRRADGTLVAAGAQAKDGGMNFAFPEPGRYVVTATYRRADPEHEGRWLVDNSTLTFDVK